uniref:NOP9 nucleolar protein n=1 Tax=Taeniopygia guttata TaxID=59729 RepID=A0A674HCT1_TAEGU|nr:nucleolar protein 9 isoform X1 [Taeniopygia guttata]
MAAHAGSPPGPGMSRQWRQSRQSWPRLDPDTAEYFRRALETLEEGLSEEELALFTPNVLSEVSQHLPAVALDPGGSRLLLLLLPQTPPTTLPTLLLHLGGVPRHPRGSRVLEAALGRVLGVLGEGRGVGEDLEGALGGLVRLFLEQDLGGLARDPNGSFVLRALLAVLGGGRDEVPPPKGAEPKTKKAELKAKGAWSLPEGAELPPSFRPLLEELAQELEQQIPALLSPACASLCLQGALGALRRSQSPSCARFCRALIGCLRQPDPAHQQSALLTSLQDPARSRLLEAAMTVLDPPGLRELFRGHLRGHLRGVASHPVANHGLQRLLDHAPEDVVSEVLSELGPALEEPLARGHPGVVLALLGAALRHPRLQGEALRWLFQALRCWAPPHHPHCVTALAKLRPLEGGASEEGAVLEPSPAGSRALQLLLRFRCSSPAPCPAHNAPGHAPSDTLNGTDHAPNVPDHAHTAPNHAHCNALNGSGHAPSATGPAPLPGPAPISRALGALSGAALVALARSGPGSRLCDVILGSKPARKWLLKRLKGQWLGLARDRFGSRVLDTAWANGNPRQRVRLATELAPHVPALLRDPFGRGVVRNFSLELFRRDRPQWERLQRGAGPKGRGFIL